MTSLTREQVLRFRVHAQQLDRERGADEDAAVLDLGVQETGPGGALWALENRGARPRPGSTFLAWTLRGPELASAIIGATRPEQVHANAAAAGVSLTDDVVAACDEALGDVPVTGQTLAVHATPYLTRR